LLRLVPVTNLRLIETMKIEVTQVGEYENKHQLLHIDSQLMRIKMNEDGSGSGKATINQFIKTAQLRCSTIDLAEDLIDAASNFLSIT
jgi:hypothetical protein